GHPARASVRDVGEVREPGGGRAARQQGVVAPLSDGARTSCGGKQEHRVNIGFVGLGAMGTGIVPRLMAAGHKVTGFNRNVAKAAPLAAAGMRLSASPREAAAETDIVFSILAHAPAGRSGAPRADGITAGRTANGIYSR